MIELHIYLEPHDGKEKDLEDIYVQEFATGIKIQKGFRRTTLLKKRDAVREYQINFEFDSEGLRVDWVNSREHMEVWPKITALCQRISWVGFDTITE